MRTHVTYLLAVALSAGLVFGAGAAGEDGVKGGGDETGPYDVVPDWPKPLHTDFTWGRTPAVWAQSSNKVYILQSAELPLLAKPIGTGGVPVRPAEGAPGQRFEHLLTIMDRDGRLLDSWEQHNALFSHSHRLAVDPRDPEMNVWIADNTQHQVFKFTNDGKKLLLTIGESKVRGGGADHLSSPSDIAFMRNGDLLVTDPGNSRVARFTRDGRFVSQFGAAGKGPGQFGGNLHGISVDARERIYVADRGNSRIQVFDKDGKFVDQWPGVRFPCFVGVDKDQFVWVADGLTNKIVKFDTDGRLLYSWGTFGGEPGQLWGPHHLSTDEQGNLYVTEVWGGRVQKFTPRKGADKSKLVGQLFWK